jgi:hypothetical protein
MYSAHVLAQGRGCGRVCRTRARRTPWPLRLSAGGPEECTRRTFEIMLPNEQHHRFWYDLVILVILVSHLLVRICGPRGARGRARLAEDEVRRVTIMCLVGSICCKKSGMHKP